MKSLTHKEIVVEDSFSIPHFALYTGKDRLGLKHGFVYEVIRLSNTFPILVQVASLPDMWIESQFFIRFMSNSN